MNGSRFAAGSGVPRGRSPLGCVQEEGSDRSLREVDELGKRPTSERSRERNSRLFAYSFQSVTTVCMNYAFRHSYRLRKRCTRNSGKLICARVDNPREHNVGTLCGDAFTRGVIPRRATLSPVPALPLEAGFQGGAAPLGVPWG